MRLIAEKSRTIAEGAGALALAAALTGQTGEGPIVCIVSGGNIDLNKFAELVAAWLEPALHGTIPPLASPCSVATSGRQISFGGAWMS